MIEVKKNTEEQTCLLVDSQTGKEIGMIKSPPIAIKLRDLYNAFENASPKYPECGQDLQMTISKDDAALIAAAADMLRALEAARKFISNGVEFGYIWMPEDGDPALETSGIIEAAIREEGRGMSYHVGRSGNWDIDTTEGALLFLESQEGGDLHSYGQHALSTLRKEIERIGAAKAEADHALGFAVEAVEKLEARGAEMCEVIVKLIAVVELYEPASRHWKLIRRAEAAIGRDEE